MRWTLSLLVLLFFTVGETRAQKGDYLPDLPAPTPLPDPSVSSPPRPLASSPQATPPEAAVPGSDPVANAATPEGVCPPAQAAEGCQRPCLGEIWGITAIRGVFDGSHMAPNGQPYNPLFDLTLDFNIGILPNKKLYVYGLADFWGQKATPGITNPSQGAFDFSKREFDLTLGAAYNYYGSWEARVFAYSYNNLNRGLSLTVPYGYLDGMGLENRYYLPGVNRYDISRLSFLSVGYLPTKDLIGQNGVDFKPSLFLRAYLTYDFLPEKLYVYTDTELYTEKPLQARIVYEDAGIAYRPFEKIKTLEFRLGAETYWDVKVEYSRTIGYGSVRILF